ncbi:MAG: 2-hydroxyacyl-CoA dehydratase family protein [Chloroflexi bacterium]|nr:2-hydroxyacyl-CoA dehydratase family protein [Chloroflexota bacterium]
MKKFLELCGFEPAEIDAELPRIQKVFDMFGINQEDIERGKDRINKFWDPELKGLAKIRGLARRELVDTILAREENKINVCASLPSATTDILNAASFHSDNVRATYPDVLVLMVMGYLFDKLDPILEAAEEHFLRPGAAQCSLLQVRLGLNVLGLYPKCDLLMSMGSLCDALPKCDEALGLYFNIPVHYINCCQDRGADWEDLYRSKDFYTNEIKKAQKKVSEVVGFEVDNDKVNEARRIRRDAAIYANNIFDLVVNSDPVPMSAACLQYIRIFRAMPVGRKTQDGLNEANKLLFEEIQERVNRGVGVVEKGAPRILYAPLVSLADPSITNMIEELGIAIPLSEDSILVPDGELRPQMDERGRGEDPWEKVAYALIQRSIEASVPMRIRAITGAVKRYHLDGVLNLFHYSCRYFAGDPLILKDAVEKATGVPVMVLEGDMYDPRFYTAEQLRTRVEAFGEMLRAAKVAHK